jgi:acyl carrier protein
VRRSVKRGTIKVLAIIRDIMADVLDIDADDIGPDTTADDVEEWDSLSHIRLMVAIERRFGIAFDNAEIAELQNVGELVALVAAKGGKA